MAKSYRSECGIDGCLTCSLSVIGELLTDGDSGTSTVFGDPGTPDAVVGDSVREITKVHFLISENQMRKAPT
jgi:hypothetical protein